MSQQIEDTKQTGGPTPPSGDVGRPQRPHRRWLGLAIALIVTAALLVSGIWSRVKARATLDAVTSRMALPAVSVVSPKQTTPAEEIILPGNVQPFSSSPIYSRTNGYLRKWYVDIGTRVKQGQLLAVIDAPEVGKVSVMRGAAPKLLRNPFTLETERLLRPYILGRNNKYSYCTARLNARYRYSKLHFKH